MNFINFYSSCAVLGSLHICCAIKNKRSTEHCNPNNETDSVDVCSDYELKNNSTTKCHQQLQHNGNNAIYNKSISYEELDLPQCCVNLASIYVECY